MAIAPSPPWTLRCPWCDWHIVVSARGMRGHDQGSGVAAANIGRKHAELVHGRTWGDFLAAESTLQNPASSSCTARGT